MFFFMKEVSVFFGVIFMINHKSLAEERPDLLKEWDYEKNNELGIYPDNVIFFTILANFILYVIASFCILIVVCFLAAHCGIVIF